MKKWFKGLWFERLVKPYLVANPLQCTQALRDPIVYQLRTANISYRQINRWMLRVTGEKIVAWAAVPGVGVTVFYDWPTQERQTALGVRGKVNIV